MNDAEATAALAVVGRYIKDFRQQAQQLCDYRTGGQWWKLRVLAGEAAEWANGGWLPHEAAPLIAAGITPAMVSDAESGTDLQARIRQLVETGQIIAPDRVIRVQDPTDPTREIITIRD